MATGSGWISNLRFLGPSFASKDFVIHVLRFHHLQTPKLPFQVEKRRDLTLQLTVRLANQSTRLRPKKKTVQCPSTLEPQTVWKKSETECIITDVKSLGTLNSHFQSWRKMAMRQIGSCATPNGIGKTKCFQDGHLATMTNSASWWWTFLEHPSRSTPSWAKKNSSKEKWFLSRMSTCFCNKSLLRSKF